jgi:hypothetical protein
MLSEWAADARWMGICDNSGFMKENMRDLNVARTVDRFLFSGSNRLSHRTAAQISNHWIEGVRRPIKRRGGIRVR